MTLDPGLIQKYDQSGPRYTSYPTAVEFSPAFGAAEQARHCRRSNEAPIPGPLSLYFHIPFCRNVCFYCGCSKIITRQRERAVPYLDLLTRELDLYRELIDVDRQVAQLHLGGGTPNFLSAAQIAGLLQAVRDRFSVVADTAADFSIEVDPRDADANTITALAQMGFNRISVGVQDFDPTVQKAVNREQSVELVAAVYDEARRQQMRSINFDLIYGLPFQSEARFSRTLDQVLEMGPDRIALFNYAHLPERFKPQRQISSDDLPSPQKKLAIMRMAMERLAAAGYDYIGMDHFARPGDSLAVAQREGRLQRNFQGYTVVPGTTLLGMGMTSISDLGTAYGQNYRTLAEYEQAILAGRLPVERGIELDLDDDLRRKIIMDLICHFRTDLRRHAEAAGVDIERYFRDELLDLKAFEDDKLVRWQGEALVVQAAGRHLIRNICMVFDRYRRAQPGQVVQGQFSKTI